MCALVLKLERLREEAKIERNASGGKCWIKERTELSDETVITILGEIKPEHWRRLLDLTIEIENSAAGPSLQP